METWWREGSPNIELGSCTTGDVGNTSPWATIISYAVPGDGSREPSGGSTSAAVRDGWMSGRQPFCRRRMYADIGDSAAALTVGSGGSGESGGGRVHESRGSGRGARWASGGGRMRWSREVGGGPGAEGGGAAGPSWWRWVADPVSFWTRLRKSLLSML